MSHAGCTAHSENSTPSGVCWDWTQDGHIVFFTIQSCSPLGFVSSFLFYFTGIYKPRLRCYDLHNLGMKFERCLDAEVVTFEILSDDYSKVITGANAENVRTVPGRWGGHIRNSLRRFFQGNHVRKCRNCLTGAWMRRYSPTIIPRYLPVLSRAD